MLKTLLTSKQIKCLKNEIYHNKEFIDTFLNNDNNTDYTSIEHIIIAFYYINLENDEVAVKHLLQSAEKGNSDAMTMLAIYYDNEKNEEEAMKYYLMAIEKGNDDAMVQLGIIYVSKNKYEEGEKYYLMAIEKGNSNAMTALGVYYEKENNHEKTEKYYLMAIEHDSDIAMGLYGWFLYENKRYNEAIKYFLMGSEKGNDNCMYWLGRYYYKYDKNIEESLKYYLMAIEKNNVYAMCNVAIYYLSIQNFDMFKEYSLKVVDKYNNGYKKKFIFILIYKLGHHYLCREKNILEGTKYLMIALENNNGDALNTLRDFYKLNIIEFYKLLNSSENKNNLITLEIENIKQQKEIIIYENKVRLFKRLNNYKKCTICLSEDVLHIDMNCGHEICINCYKPNMKCYYPFCKC